MSATIFTDVAAAAVAAIDTAAITSLGATLKVYAYDLRDLDSLPAVTLNGPVSFTRADPDEPESQLGSADWRMTFDLMLYVALDDPETAATEYRSVLGQVIAAIDADATLGGTALIGASVADGALEYAEQEGGRQMAIYRCSLNVWALVAQ